MRGPVGREPSAGLARALLICILALTFQVLCAPLYEIAGARPWFPAIAAVLVFLDGRLSTAIWAALLLGLLSDWASADPWGSSTGGLCALALLVDSVRRRGWTEDPLPRALVCLLGIAFLFVVRSLVIFCYLTWLPPLRPELASLVYTWVCLAPVSVLLTGCIRGSRAGAGVKP